MRGEAAAAADEPKLAAVAGPMRGLRVLELGRWCAGGLGISASASPGTRKGAFRSISMTRERRLPRRGLGRPAGLSVAAPACSSPLSSCPCHRDQPFPPLKPSRSASSTAYWRGGLLLAEDCPAPPISLVRERRRVRRCSCRIRRDSEPLVSSADPSSASRAAASTSDTSSPALRAARAMAVSSTAPGDARPAGARGATPLASAACRPGGPDRSLITAVARSLSSASPPEAPMLMRRACGRRDDGSAIAQLRVATACNTAAGQPTRSGSAGDHSARMHTRAGCAWQGPREPERPVLERRWRATCRSCKQRFGSAALAAGRHHTRCVSRRSCGCRTGNDSEASRLRAVAGASDSRLVGRGNERAARSRPMLQTLLR